MFNPRITSMQPDELTMQDSGEGSEFTFEFNYDSLFVDPNQSMNDFGPSRVEQLSGGDNVLYPLIIVPSPEGAAGGGGKGGGADPVGNAQAAATDTINSPGGNNKLGLG